MEYHKTFVKHVLSIKAVDFDIFGGLRGGQHMICKEKRPKNAMFSHQTFKFGVNSTREVRSSFVSRQKVHDLRSAICRRRTDQSPVPSGTNTFL